MEIDLYNLFISSI